MPARPLHRVTRAALVLGGIFLAVLLPGSGTPAWAGVAKVVMIEDFTSAI